MLLNRKPIYLPQRYSEYDVIFLRRSIAFLMSRCLTQVRGEVHSRHERQLRDQQNQILAAAEVQLQQRLRALRDGMAHVSEVVHVLRELEVELTRIRQKDIMTFTNEFSRAWFHEGEHNDLSVQKIAVEVAQISSQYASRQREQARRSIEDDARHLIETAEKDGEASWIKAVAAVHDGWIEGGRYRAEFDDFVKQSRDNESGVVERYIEEQVHGIVQYMLGITTAFHTFCVSV